VNSKKEDSKKEEHPADAGGKESPVQPGDDGSNKEEPPIDGVDYGGDNGSNNDELPGNGDDNTADTNDDDDDEDDDEKEPANDDGVDDKLKSKRKNSVAEKLVLIWRRHQRSKDKTKLSKEVDDANDGADVDGNNAVAKEQPNDDADVDNIAEKLELIKKRHQHSKAKVGQRSGCVRIACFAPCFAGYETK
jgi:hypothetical protein